MKKNRLTFLDVAKSGMGILFAILDIIGAFLIVYVFVPMPTLEWWQRLLFGISLYIVGYISMVQGYRKSQNEKDK